ncbi:FMN-linked oxidoreductase [Coniophora puteana RWD-64-598 SS2]|uniref:FMN-linked oxidoreductase n=1 Tax=Coniophora puteana (strain RWD-64-598) TaxID=741705 RepID=A0A5M3M8P3_CONPW|nr:FMN-linked oxidoreductase [Coniophora puteana RWD-64-598 SS2]EIW75160.1 FMN-linked oxidoreductase [Coniophora puteana RWD-64-598 SS2]
MAASDVPALFKPIYVGDLDLKHRVVLAPLTRFRAYDDHVHGPQAATYYAQRSRTFIAPQAGGLPNVPGIYTEAQIEAWKAVTDAVHSKGSYIYLQLWALGRTANSEFLASHGHDLVGASSIPLTKYGHVDAHHRPEPPRALSIPEIKEYAQLYARAAKNAIKAGFDGVEILGGSGYLIDQFLQDVSNNRIDEYGGSIENRARFALEVVDAVVTAVGASRIGFRMSPYSEFQDMRMADPIPTFTYLVSKLKEYGLAYIHVTEPRIHGPGYSEEGGGVESNDPIRKVWGERPYIAAAGFTRAKALKVAEEKGGLVAFGSLFISNPDLPHRLQDNLPMTEPDRTKFYLVGNHTPEGYTDWEFAGVSTRL